MRRFPIRIGPCTLRWAPLLLAVALAVPSPGAQVSAAPSDDDSFLRSLEQASAGDPVDTRRLAKLLFGAAATLDGGRASVRLLGRAVDVRESSRDSVSRTVEARYQGYSGAVDRLQQSVSVLLDRPDSRAALFRTVASGHEACWKLEGYTRFVETYGAGGGDLMRVLSSTRACSRFRRAAMQRQVVNLLAEVLDETDDLRREVRDLREELAEFDRLLEDLRRIDGAE